MDQISARLLNMSESLWFAVRERIRHNPYCIARNTASIEVLKTLIKHPNADVRLAVIDNELISPSLLTCLVKDRDHYVRYAVAIHPLTSKKDLIRLAHDKDTLVLKGVSENTLYRTEIKPKTSK